MPITSKTDWSSNLTTFIVNGEISADEVLSVLNQLYESPDHPPTLNVLWDLREISPVTSIKDEDLNEIVSFLSIHSAKRIEGKTAIVARSDFEYKLSKRYGLFTQLKGVSVIIKTFRTLGEAMIWLGES